MANPSKVKGTRFETDHVNYLAANGFPHAERRALAGAKDKGDVTGTPGISWEDKAAKAIALAAWIDETEVERQNASAEFGVLTIKRRQRPIEDAYCVMPLSAMVILLRQAGYGDPIDDR